MSKELEKKVFEEGVTVESQPGAGDYYAPVIPEQEMKYVVSRLHKKTGKRIATEFGMSASLGIAIPAAMWAGFTNSDPAAAVGMAFSSIPFIAGFWGVISSVAEGKPNLKYQKVFDDFNERNKEAFLIWLKERYNIVYEPREEESSKVTNLASFNIVNKGEDIITDVTGAKYRVKKNDENQLYVVAYEVAPEELIHNNSVLEIENSVLEGEPSSIWDAIHKKLNVLSEVKLDAEEDHVVSRVKQDLLEFSSTVKQLKKLDQLNPEDAIIVGVLNGLNRDLQTIIDSKANDLKRTLSGQFEWVSSRNSSKVSAPVFDLRSAPVRAEIEQ